MNTLGLVSTQGLSTAAIGAVPATGLQLRIHDTIGSAHRLWVRGRLLDLPIDAPPQSSRWWKPWRGNNQLPAAIPLVHIQTQVAGKSLEANVPLGPHGEFEATFDIDLPPTRRGWRVARNQVTHLGTKREACGLVLTPPADAAGVAVVILPRSETMGADGLQRLAQSPVAALLAERIQGLQRGPGGRQPIFYVACVPPASDGIQAELALALTALGWPHGRIILLPTVPGQANGEIAAVIDRLRWLFAGELELSLLNVDPAAQDVVDNLTAAADRTAVRTVAAPASELGRPAFLPVIARARGPASRPIRAGHVTRHPLVFCHGMLACSMLRMQLSRDFNYFSGMGRLLEERGFRVLFPRVTPTGGVVERARQLRDQIRSWTDEPVNIVAHSMGGLDARYLISRLDMADRVRSLTTVATPHLGSYMADWFLANFRQRVPLLLALEAVGVSVDGFGDCRPAICRAFNSTTPDMPQVRYFSYGGDVPLARVTPMLRRAWDLLTPLEGPNDGLVSVKSARWGEHLGNVCADHFAQTPDGLFIHPEEDFDALGFFLSVVDDLARRGF
ncbi:MAG: hypothetical protein K2R98_23680 [Gemmataceae bacterium]|nr:hypothetical protein [Gemmataceae bacterium]